MAFGSAQTAPLAIAVIGGLLASLAGTLFVVPSAFALLTSGVPARSPSIDPDDPASRFFGASGLVFLMLLPALPSVLSAQESVSAEVVAVESGRLERTRVLPVELRPFQEVELRARVQGFVDSISVDRGSRVRKGDVVALLRAPELEARKAEAEAELTGAEAARSEAEARLAASESTFERLRKAAETPGVVAGNDLLLAEKTADADRARVRALEKSVDAARAAFDAVSELAAYLRVEAPFEGVVTERRVHPGSLVGPAGGEGLVRIEQVGRLRLVIPVPESFATSVSRGMEVSFSVSAHPEESFSASVSRPALSIAPDTRTMAVEADVDNREGRLAPGMYAEVSWPVRRPEESLFVPRSAVAETTERIFVIRVREGRAEWVDVRRGVFEGARVEVFGDLGAGDLVVARASDEIRPGTRIESR
jgi:RND family efflux transporter MFP subunit